MKEIIVRTHQAEADQQLIGMLEALFPDVTIRIECTITRMPSEVGDPLPTHFVFPVYKEC